MSTERRLRLASITAARWWGNRLRATSRSRVKPSEAKIRKFEQYLAEAIDSELGQRQNPYGVKVMMDWRPDAHLSHAACRAGFDVSAVLLSFKSFTVVTEDKVKAKEGEVGRVKTIKLIASL